MMDTPDAEAIQRRMKAIRSELGCEMEVITERVRDFGVWQLYVKKHPWICLGGAAILGYWIIPRKSRTPEHSLPLRVKQLDSRPAISNSQQPQGVVAVVFDVLAAAALRGVTNYIGYRVAKMLENYQESTREKETI